MASQSTALGTLAWVSIQNSLKRMKLRGTKQSERASGRLNRWMLGLTCTLYTLDYQVHLCYLQNIGSAPVQTKRTPRPWPFAVVPRLQSAPSSNSLFNAKCTCALKICIQPGVVLHALNPSSWKAEAGESLNPRPAWSIQ